MRRFTRASTERIYVAAAGLAGFNYQWGTIAVLVNMVTSPDAETYVGTNDGGAASVDFWHDGTVIAWYDGSATNSFNGTTPPDNAPALVGVTKVAGSVQMRGHVYEFGTGVWTHNNSQSAQADAAATTSLSIGCYNDAGGDPLDAEIGAVAMWSGYMMPDQEFERLARGNWASRSPSFLAEFFTAQDSVGDMARTHGRNRVTQTARTGTTLGTTARPSGFRPSLQTRRR